MLRPCHSSQGHSTARPSLDGLLCCGLEKNGMVGAWHGHGMASVNQTRQNCVNQMGKTHSKPLAARHGRGTACYVCIGRKWPLISTGAHSRTILRREKGRQNSIQKLRRNFLKGFDWIDVINEVKRDIPRPWDAFRKRALFTTTVRISSSHFTGFRLIPRGSSEQSVCEIYRLNCFSLVKYIHKL